MTGQTPLPKVTGNQRQKFRSGFTLAELLIALTIMAEIATFTIPKLLLTLQNQMNNARAKEVIAMIGSAVPAMQKDGVWTDTMVGAKIIPYLNYMAIDNTSLIDANPNSGTPINCASGGSCIRLHNGGMLWFGGSNFGGTNTTNVITFIFDPDGTYNAGTGMADAPGKGIKFGIYYTGRITTRGALVTGSQDSGNSYSPSPAADPSWFSW